MTYTTQWYNNDSLGVARTAADGTDLLSMRLRGRCHGDRSCSRHIEVSETRAGTDGFASFVELREFTDNWARLGLTDERDLLALQLLIMAGPKRAPVIRGTGGLRKLRFSPADWPKGARDALRICYVYFEEFGIVPLVLVYSKSESDEISEAGKKAIRRLIAETQRYLRDCKRLD